MSCCITVRASVDWIAPASVWRDCARWSPGCRSSRSLASIRSYVVSDCAISGVNSTCSLLIRSTIRKWLTLLRRGAWLNRLPATSCFSTAMSIAPTCVLVSGAASGSRENPPPRRRRGLAAPPPHGEGITRLICERASSSPYGTDIRKTRSMTTVLKNVEKSAHHEHVRTLFLPSCLSMYAMIQCIHGKEVYHFARS